nr:phage tail protein [Lysinibacillus sp. OL1_EC]
MANFDAWQAQEKANFDAWFASIQNILDGDIAATLAAKITTLEQGFEAHENKTATTSTPGHVKIVDSVSSESTTEAVTPRAVKQVNDTLTTHADDFTSHVRFGVTSEADAKTITLTPAPTSLVMGMGIAFANTVDNTGPVTLNVNGLGVKPVINSKGEQLKAGALRANSICTVRYNNGNFILQGDGSGQDIPNILEGLNEIRDISESYAITTAVAINGVFVGTNSAVKVTNNVNGTAVGAYYELNNGFSQTNIAGIANTLGLYVETDDSAFYSVGVSTIAKYINKGQDRVYYITMGASYNKAFNLSNEDVSDNAGHVFIRDIKNIYKVRTSDGAIIKTFNHIISGDLVEYCVNVEDQAVYIIDTQRRVKKLNFDLVQVWEKTGWAMYEPASTINIKITTGKGRHPVVMHVVNGNLDTVYFTKFDKDSGEIISSKVTRNVPLSNAVNYNSIGYFGGSLVYFDDFGMFYFDPDTYDYLSKTTSIWGETPSISTKIAPARDGKAIGIGESGSQGRLSFIKPKYKILEQ